MSSRPGTNASDFWHETRSDTGLVVRLVGELTIHLAAMLRERALATLKDSAQIMVRLDEVSYIDAAAVQVLYAWKCSLKSSGRTLSLVGVQENTRADLELVGLASLLIPESNAP